MTSQDYADLSQDSYTSRAKTPEGGSPVTIGQHQYSVLDNANNPKTGYQGTIYQRVDTKEIVVAHRGTEFDREAIRDGLQADGGMVFNRSNLQVDDAVALTRKALELARDQAVGGRAPPVAVTGHSLGGTLAQVTAHHFDLKGETFNAYGANSLGLRIPEGGSAVINHVMAGDLVSAGSGHYGQVKTYAEPQEINSLRANGYDNNRNAIDLIRDLSPAGEALRATTAAISMADSHKMHHFVNTDGSGFPDRSVLGDSAAIERAQTNATAITEYRSDVRNMRSTLTVVGRGAINGLIDGVNTLRGPLEPGEPARIEAEKNERHPSTGSRSQPSSLSPTSHSLLESSERHVRQVAADHQLPWNTGMDNTAHAIAANAREQGMSDINLFRVADGQIRYGQLDGAMLKDGVIDARQAANHPKSESLERMGQLDQQRGLNTFQALGAEQTLAQAEPHVYSPEPIARSM